MALNILLIPILMSHHPCLVAGSWACHKTINLRSKLKCKHQNKLFEKLSSQKSSEKYNLIYFPITIFFIIFASVVFFPPILSMRQNCYCAKIGHMRRAYNTAPLLVLTHLGQRLREMSCQNFARAPPGLSPNRGKFWPPLTYFGPP